MHCQTVSNTASASTSAFAVVIAAFWHVHWIAGVVVLVCGIAGVVVHSLYYQRLLREGKVKLPENMMLHPGVAQALAVASRASLPILSPLRQEEMPVE
jgi:hypothetical protein